MSICLYNGTLLSGFSVMEKCAVLIEDGKIADVFSQKRFEQKRFASKVRLIDVEGAYIAPGLIDTHIHGFNGHGTEDISADSILAMSKDLADYGVSSFNPTLYSSDEPTFVKAIEAVTEAMGKEEGARIMGIHLEGPFVSPDKAGVQRPETIKGTDIEMMERLWQASKGTIVNMTVAPEVKGMRELALYCIKRGIVLQAGHTNALYENMVEGMQAGILHSTHLFNAMSQMHHRNPGAVGAVLIHPEMSCEVIADGVHVHPDLFKLLMRDKPIDKIVLVTDALKPTEQAGSELYANGEQVVFEGGCFHRKADGVIAGSALTMIRGVKNLVSFGFPVGDAVRCASTNPAQIMRYAGKGQLIPGYDGDVVVFDKYFNVLISVIAGDIKKNIM
ncbi:N-acetylglucosamine-6-phosphate deacetylase [Treponema brennaborense]|uniref:N-acetylglucosamine-6-phosphate deacetylase n=1 Tax=Treponema brennaborense (strain DSM 12168 / CIP 105900 / DD5/3) TaxID=906968 RepID=F4LJQ8_TREBD|nr:N-acetylglucosamine-6-phosphate deacetylase [Treponema brennaborense]AEE17438.1 N-acetylglucosamine-6-phosphate deacetylase [Treponema brennaborense DSM 12168]